MKKFTKLMLATAAITAVSATMAVSAMAMSATYADGTVTLADVNATGDSQTLLVLDTVELTTVAAENIKQIDQKDDGTSFADVTVGELANGTYEVRIGGDGTVQTATFTVGEEPGPTTHDVLIGDVDQNGRVTSGDASLVLTLVAEKTTNTLTGDALIAAQKCNGTSDERVTSADAGEILTWNANKKHDYVNTTIEVED